MNLTKFYKVPLVALLTFTAVVPASAVFAEGSDTGAVTTPAPATSEPAPVNATPETAPETTVPAAPAPAESTPATPAPTTSPTDVLTPSPNAPSIDPADGTPTNSTTNIDVSGTLDAIQPSFSTDFTSIFFTGVVGTGNNTPVYKMGTEVVSQPNVYMTARTNYSLMISGTDLMTTQGEMFTVGRIGVSVGNGSYVPLSNVPSLIDSGAGELSIHKPIAFKLDLTTRNNSFPDSDRLEAITEDTEFTNTITFSYTGL